MIWDLHTDAAAQTYDIELQHSSSLTHHIPSLSPSLPPPFPPSSPSSSPSSSPPVHSPRPLTHGKLEQWVRHPPRLIKRSGVILKPQRISFKELVYIRSCDNEARVCDFHLAGECIEGLAHRIFRGYDVPGRGREGGKEGRREGGRPVSVHSFYNTHTHTHTHTHTYTTRHTGNCDYLSLYISHTTLYHYTRTHTHVPSVLCISLHTEGEGQRRAGALERILRIARDGDGDGQHCPHGNDTGRVHGSLVGGERHRCRAEVAGKELDVVEKLFMQTSGGERNPPHAPAHG